MYLCLWVYSVVANCTRARLAYKWNYHLIPLPDPNEPPVMECALSCDNLLCDALGRAPSARLVVSLRTGTGKSDRSPPRWRRFAQTEVVERSSNPTYLRTVAFRTGHLGAASPPESSAAIRVTAYDVRERLTATRTMLGQADVYLGELLSSG